MKIGFDLKVKIIDVLTEKQIKKPGFTRMLEYLTKGRRGHHEKGKSGGRTAPKMMERRK